MCTVHDEKKINIFTANKKETVFMASGNIIGIPTRLSSLQGN